MKNIILSLGLIFYNSLCIAQNIDSLKNQSRIGNHKIDYIENENLKSDIASVDTLYIYNKNISSPEAYNWSKNMPWVGAIIIGILTFGGNLIVSYYTRKSNKSVAIQQIENSRKIAEEQMLLLKNNNERDFKKTIISGSIQLWINDFRNIISEILSTIEVVRFNEVINEDSIQKIHLLISKCEILLGYLSYHILSSKLKELKELCLQIPTGNKEFYDLDELITQIKSESLIALKEQSELAKKVE